MANAVIMPKAGITVESCIIGAWEKKVGDKISVGDILFTYETDKASFECESTEEGTLLEIFYSEGDEVPCLVNVCAIGAEGDDISALRPTDSAQASPEAPAEVKIETKIEEKKAEPVVVSNSGSSPVSPRAKKLAERAGVDPTLASGSGPSGRIIERDIRELINSGVVNSVPASASAPETEYEDIKFSSIRKAISKTMSQSLSTMAQLTHNTSFDATNIMALRKQFKAMGGEYAGITLGDIILFAVSRTLLSHPDLNANMLDDNTIRRFKSVNLGVAVDTERGLMVPTIFGADKKSLLEISKEVKELASACRNGNISPDKLSRGSFTVSNLGNLGVESFTPVINPPQTGLLGVCTITDKPRKGENGIELYPSMGLSLTYDHRAVDGSPAARFQKDLMFNLENIMALLVK